MAKITEKGYLDLWDELRDNIFKSAPVELNETTKQKKKRIADLEKDDEKWYEYYFPDYYTAKPTKWHIKASREVLQNPEFFAIWSFARELAKTARAMMAVLKLVLTGKKKNTLMVSSTFDNAERLLAPYKAQLEFNSRIINDYGVQQSIGKWEAGEFKTKKGASFRALGSGQSPRGTRNDAVRPDIILIDDIDTDEECRSKKRIKAKVKWIMEALIPTRSISGKLLLLVCGNIIAKYCCITELAKKADTHIIKNIRDKNGKSEWPEKNSEADIDRVLGMITWSAAQKEYYNNPISEGDTFKTIKYGKAPKLSSCDSVLVYADPSPSNKNKGSTGVSHKCVIVIGYKDMVFYIYRIWLDQCGQSTFVDWLFAANNYLKLNDIDYAKIYIENNSLQDPNYKQIILPLVRERQEIHGHLPITPDDRKKPDKFTRIDGTLEPLNRNGDIVFDERLKSDPYMEQMEEQMLGVDEEATVMDGPDALEGGVFLLKKKKSRKKTGHRSGARPDRKY